MTAPAPNSNKMDITTSKKTNNSSHANLPQASLKQRGLNDVNNSIVSDDRHNNTLPTSHNKNHENDAITVKNSYTADNRERLLNHTVNITFERDRYNTPITIEFHQKSE